MITGKTNIVGLIGHPVEHSMSPAMHNAAFEYMGLDYVYVSFNVSPDNLEDAINGARSMGIKGLNVTIPHKIRVMNYLDEIDQTAGLIGAVNTIHFHKNEIKGYNTDGVGAVRALEEVTPVKDKKIVMIGAGGAARAVAFQLILSGIKDLTLINRTIDKAKLLKNEIETRIESNVSYGGFDILKEEVARTDILIDTTPVGMYPNIDDKPVVSADLMHSKLVVNDLVYNPLQTNLLKEANKAGAVGISGLKMLIYQGVESFKIWTSQEPPFNIMEKGLNGLL